jgi:pyruvate carboxylase subunit A
MLKATNGGGGRGIRQCADDAELLRNYERVVSEASKAFGKPEVFVEKCIVAPRHIEVQVLADAHGNVVHLFERDCSIQRRNQKLIEIAPSPQLSPRQRQYGSARWRSRRRARWVTRMPAPWSSCSMPRAISTSWR